MRTLVLHIPAPASAPLSWALFEAPLAAPIRAGSVEPGFALNLDVPLDRCWVLVPGTQATVHSAELPAAAGEHKLTAAAAFALEDAFAVDPAALHLALGPAAGGRRRVAVVDDGVMKEWLTTLTALGVRADVLMPDFLAVSNGPVALGGTVLVNGETGSFSAERQLADHLVETDISIREVTAAEFLQQAYAALIAGPHVNLLQGRYAPRRDWAAALRPWRRAGALAAGTAAAALIGLAVDGARLGRQAEAATARAEAVFRTALPEVKRVVNPGAQMRAHLQSTRLTGVGGFVALSETLVNATAAVPEAEVTVLRFDGKRAEISATFSLPSFGEVERVKAEIVARGGLVQEGGARQDGNRILADVSVKLR